MTTALKRSDLIVLDSLGRTALLVEVKALEGTDREWATQYRRNLAVHGVLVAPTYVMFATPGKFYLWSPEDALSLEEVPPSVEIDAAEALGPRVARTIQTLEGVWGETLELLVFDWLAELTRLAPQGGGNLPGDEMAWQGFLHAIRNGTVQFDQTP